MKKEKTLVTPWEVKGDVDYDKLVKEFGVSKLEGEILDKLKQHTKEINCMIKRKVLSKSLLMNPNFAVTFIFGLSCDLL